MKHRVLPTFGLAVVCLACAVPVLAQKLEGVPPKTGHATFTFASKDLTYDVVEGGFQQVEGFTTATLVFRPAVKPKANSHLNLTLMYQAPGKVDLAAPFSVNGQIHQREEPVHDYPDQSDSDRGGGDGGLPASS